MSQYHHKSGLKKKTVVLHTLKYSNCVRCLRHRYHVHAFGMLSAIMSAGVTIAGVCVNHKSSGYFSVILELFLSFTIDRLWIVQMMLHPNRASEGREEV